MQRTKHINVGRLALTGVVAASLGCSSGGNDSLPTDGPTTLERVADEGFTNAGSVAVSPDGETFYVLAYDADAQPTVFALDVASQTLEALHVGAPMLYPADVATSCDGETIYVADMGSAGMETSIGGGDKDANAARAGGIYSMDTGGGAPSQIQATGISAAAGVVVSHDCSLLYVSGWTDAGAPAVFRVPLAGGAADVIHEGAPLVSPGGIHIDENDVIWQMDFAARGEEGEGSLFAITTAGEVTPALTGVAMGRVGGVSLVPGGITAVVPANDADGKAVLITANTENGAKEVTAQPDLQFPTGVAAARNAPVMAIATENAIYSATFE
jgi:sugar lactone lactonase YvrE